ncbi:DgyrCDS14932 [Dimorphilus gyrociliatus]|uniref:DgyrCDS14932 n=1 Tax=Dimorphilus gyrociliatus TaxID=2664684 RepID=A0A7I8WFE1_9ANNE|nr:DgyrCDS14932 [Dimorphilus gyrociliatus]
MFITLLSIGVTIVLIRYIEQFLRSFYISDLENKYVLITGCDTGFGNLLAKSLDNKGINVIATCLTENGAKQLSDCCSMKLTTYILNVTNEDEIDNLKEMITKKVGDKGLHALVNNAGILGKDYGSPETLLMSNLTEILKINSVAPAVLCFKFLELLNMGKGRIINMGSLAGRVPSVHFFYGISKFCIEGLSSILSFQLKKYDWNVSVHTIEPEAYSTTIAEEDELEKSVVEGYKRVSKFSKEKYPTVDDYLQIFLYELAEIPLNDRVEDVTNAYEHAILSVWPKNRYSVGNMAKYVIIPLSYLPTSITDKIFVE